ncbi:fatty acyl-AMP ligase [Nocardia terpenica]|uniref:fatty acyl-AMP ligase n=1 Tax=Nocardia terpenica TaxID=455432 RepID=UPI00189357B0|nr:fatty acyl-AMP ligase [Nocardia terpenica]MBF6062966.1 fatty acyl-AMP ligase [Nocardia terpenica]MBF6104899.1 fatty acyl-AMP ligase [Nocardia terpenica]MBF6112664.1 fatty acyl-AMP ligase [Nocardia terpenica]MBF6118627.1 fatty acyl-AMP ligase [Nocardia terpenica]MBF6155106.1 fatty acyl-AMP ligase [Nocardia terpenica]
MNTVDMLAAAVARRAQDRPDDPAFTALSYPDGDPAPNTLTHGRLHTAAGALAERIRGVTVPGDRVAILCEHGLDYVVAFLACLYSARVAVPLFPVSARRGLGRLAAMLADAAPALSLVSPGAETATARAGLAVGRVLATATEPTAPPVLDPIGDDPAYLLYTADSALPESGIAVTHANLAAALEQLRTGLPATAAKPIVTWLPFHHDMGLILALALPLYTGVPAVTLAPAAFAVRPARWLRACSDYRAGTTVSPNFGLTLAISGSTAAERAGLDLSALDLLINGAEPIRAEALAAFTKTFSPYGFRHRAHTPGYGFAGATLPVAYLAQDEEPTAVEFDRAALAAGRAVVAGHPPQGLALVGCGVPAGPSVRVVDPIHRVELAPGEIGEIWVAGPNVCPGYFRRPRATAAFFGAELPDSPEKWLRTGDLGFFHDGQLYLSGRLADMLVLGGRRHYPADVEATAVQAVPELRPDRIAAFVVECDERETLVLLAELTDRFADPGEVVRQIRTAVTTTHDIAAVEVVLVAPGAIPTDTAGRPARGRCRTRYLAGWVAPGTR